MLFPIILFLLFVGVILYATPKKNKNNKPFWHPEHEHALQDFLQQISSSQDLDSLEKLFLRENKFTQYADVLNAARTEKQIQLTSSNISNSNEINSKSATKKLYRFLSLLSLASFGLSFFIDIEIILFIIMFFGLIYVCACRNNVLLTLFLIFSVYFILFNSTMIILNLMHSEYIQIDYIISLIIQTCISMVFVYILWRLKKISSEKNARKKLLEFQNWIQRNNQASNLKEST